MTTRTPPPESDRADRARALSEVVSRLRRALRRTSRLVQGRGGLPMAQAELLAWLAEHPRARVTDVASALTLASNTVTTLVNALEGAGLVRRLAATEDRRAVRLELTEAGARQLANWQECHDELLMRALALLHAADRRALTDVVPALDRLVCGLARADGAVAAQDRSPVAREARS